MNIKLGRLLAARSLVAIVAAGGLVAAGATVPRAAFAGVSAGVGVVNLSDTSATLIWNSAAAEVGSINYGSSCGAKHTGLTSTAGPDAGGFVHALDLSGLTPSADATHPTTYFYDIVSGSTTDDNGGKCYTFKMLPSPPGAPPPPLSAAGFVRSGPNCDQPVKSGIVTVTDSRNGATSQSNESTINPGSDASAQAGTYLVSFSPAANGDSTDFFTPQSGDIITVSADAGTLRGKSSALYSPATATNPAVVQVPTVCVVPPPRKGATVTIQDTVAARFPYVSKTTKGKSGTITIAVTLGGVPAGDVRNAPVTFILTPMALANVKPANSTNPVACNVLPTVQKGIVTASTALCPGMKSLPVGVYSVHAGLDNSTVYNGAAPDEALAIYDPAARSNGGAGKINHAPKGKSAIYDYFAFLATTPATPKSALPQGSFLYLKHDPAGDLTFISCALTTQQVARTAVTLKGTGTTTNCGSSSAFGMTADSKTHTLQLGDGSVKPNPINGLEYLKSPVQLVAGTIGTPLR